MDFEEIVLCIVLKHFFQNVFKFELDFRIDLKKRESLKTILYKKKSNKIFFHWIGNNKNIVVHCRYKKIRWKIVYLRWKYRYVLHTKISFSIKGLHAWRNLRDHLAHFDFTVDCLIFQLYDITNSHVIGRAETLEEEL